MQTFFALAKRETSGKAINVFLHLQKSRFHLTALVRTHTSIRRHSEEEENQPTCFTFIVASVEFVGLISADMLSQFQLSPERTVSCSFLAVVVVVVVVTEGASPRLAYYYIKQVVQLNIYMLFYPSVCQIHHLCRSTIFVSTLSGWIRSRFSSFFCSLAAVVVDFFDFFFHLISSFRSLILFSTLWINLLISYLVGTQTHTHTQWWCVLFDTEFCFLLYILRNTQTRQWTKSKYSPTWTFSPMRAICLSVCVCVCVAKNGAKRKKAAVKAEEM